MRLIFTILSAVLFLSFQTSNNPKLGDTAGNQKLNLFCPDPPSFTETVKTVSGNKGANSGKDEIDQDWYAGAMEQIEKEEYNISYSEGLGAYQSPNRANNIRFIYHKDGFTAVMRDLKNETSEDWKIKLRITNYDLQMNNGIIAEGNKAYTENESIRIDYVNTKEGMRQDFIIKKKPEGENKLKLNLTADTKLKLIVGADALMFKDEKGIDRMKYSALKCWDANGKELRGYFENSYKLQVSSFKLKDGNLKSSIHDQKSFAIVVNDEEAVYPITIDPLSTSPSWSAESDQSGAQFGFSVSTAGDVNGDGYSDVIVGAPYFDNGVTDAGKTFVFYGSATGLSVSANWTSEGNSNQINQGYSVSTAGDVNGDGFSDVIVSVKNINLSWVTQNSGTVQNLQDVYFTSPSKGWAVGAGGVIVATTDRGLNWTSQSSGTTNDFRSNWFTTPDSGWAVGLNGTIKVTTDGGANWATQTSGTTTNLTCVYFRTSQEGYVLGGNGLIRKTTNAGLNWTAQASGITAELRDVIFTSSATGWVVGANGRILRTTNGGSNWVIQTSGTTQTLRAVYFSSALNGMAFGHAGTFEKTTDGGSTWSTSAIGSFQDLYGCSFTSSLVGWTVGFGSTVLKTTDGGSSWISKNSGISGDLRSVFFSAPDSGFTVGSGGILYNYNASAPSNGIYASVYNGSASGLSATPNIDLTGSSGISTINNNVSTAGDINGDGYSDVIIGSPNTNSGTGAVLVYHGSATGSQSTPNTTLTGSQANALYGVSVSTAGDPDGDGYSDIIVGSSDFDNGQTNEGVAYVYRGSVSGIISTPYWTYESNQANSRFGASVSTAGDVNGDGYSDVVAGSPDYFLSAGRALLFLGSGSGISLTPDWTYETPNLGEQIGYSVSTAGDVNGDGYADVIVGSPNYSNGEINEGRALVFQGSAMGLSAAPNWTNEGNQISDNYGNSVFTAGDINGDGFSDVIVGAKLYDNGEADEGTAFVYCGSSSGLSATSNWTSASGQTGSYFGYSVASAGDVNGDGYSDVILGAPSYDNGETDEGKFFAFYGSSSGLSVTPDYSAIEGNQTGAQLGLCVSTAGDVNGDGYSDVLIGVPFFDQGQNNEGLVYLVYGSVSGLESGIEWSAQSNQTGALFGYSVATAGDVNGDGYSDVLIGSSLYDNGQTDEGKVFLWNGSSSGPGVNGTPLNADWTAESNQSGADFGISIATAGDINGDGFSDVIIGADKYDNGETDEGKFYAYYGSVSGLPATPDYSAVEGNQTGANLGYSVSSAGDVNGDGFSDVLIGVPYFDLGQTDEGLVYMIYGSASGLEYTVGWTGESDQTNAGYGNSVSSAGDVNGDGYSDVIVGAVTYDNGEFDEGGAFLYQGSASGLSAVANWTGESNQVAAYFGKCVSSAGDVNGDGYSDVIIGSTQYTSEVTNEGAAFVYYGNNEAGLRSTVQQYKPGSANVVSSGGLTGINGQVRLNTFGKSPYGRADGKIVYEYKSNGVKFSGATITNSTSYSGSGTNTDLGISGSQLQNDISGLLPIKEYKWRARVQYSLVNNSYQKFGPWKYYNNYVPTPLGNFRPWDGNPLMTTQQLDLTMFIQGFYNSGTNFMIGDTVKVYLRNGSSPYSVVDSAKSYVNSSGQGVFTFSNAADGTPYYIELVQRNSIETWSKITQQFTASALTYDFTTSNTQAYGNNMASVDASPVRYGIYSGDENQNGIVDLTDVVNVSNAASSFTNGYVPTDMNGDNVVDLSDLVITSNNASAFVGKIVP
jgi:photosystem II stability/assembly factor-like uncharacterized protein